MGTDYSFYVKSIETHARSFFKVIIFSIGSVPWAHLDLGPKRNKIEGTSIQKLAKTDL